MNEQTATARSADNRTRESHNRPEESFKRTRKHTKAVLAVVDQVATLRGVDPSLILSPRRESEKAASARLFAMGASIAKGIPFKVVATTFRRDWATTYRAEVMMQRRLKSSTAFLAEWQAVAASAE
jgi:hypothetical protein